MFFKIESRNFQVQFEMEFRETLQNFNSIRQPIKKDENNNCLNQLNELKFCEVSWNSISNRCWKFQLSILKKKVLFQKKNFLSPTAKIDPKDGISRPNFQWRFCLKVPSNHWKPRSFGYQRNHNNIDRKSGHRPRH